MHDIMDANGETMVQLLLAYENQQVEENVNEYSYSSDSDDDSDLSGHEERRKICMHAIMDANGEVMIQLLLEYLNQQVEENEYEYSYSSDSDDDSDISGHDTEDNDNCT
jgi:hypothetical protein